MIRGCRFRGTRMQNVKHEYKVQTNAQAGALVNKDLASEGKQSELN